MISFANQGTGQPVVYRWDPTTGTYTGGWAFDLNHYGTIVSGNT